MTKSFDEYGPEQLRSELESPLSQPLSWEPDTGGSRMYKFDSDGRLALVPDSLGFGTEGEATTQLLHSIPTEEIKHLNEIDPFVDAELRGMSITDLHLELVELNDRARAIEARKERVRVMIATKQAAEHERSYSRYL